jgi:hypothetical protein
MTVGNLFEVEFFEEDDNGGYYPEELYTTQEA